jgi:hypothetical protein
MQYNAMTESGQRQRYQNDRNEKRRPQYGLDLTAKYEHEERMKTQESELMEMKMALEKLSMGKDKIPMFFDPDDLAKGSYGVHIDKYLGRSPSDGPAGYVFQKVTYSAGAIVNKGNIAGMYKLCPDHMGYIYHEGSTVLTIATSDVTTGTDTITATAHGLLDGEKVVYAANGGTVMAGLADGVRYFIVNKATNSFKLAATAGGSAINITGTGNSAQTLTVSNEVRINQDGADLSGASDPTPSGISGEAKLVPGDMILGAILQLLDTRSSDNRTGFVTAGLVSNDSAVPDSYGAELASDPSNFITGSAISGGRVHAAAGLKACSVASPNLNIYSPTIVATAQSDLSAAQIGAPINAINVSGVQLTDSNQIRFVLNVYALVGARQKTISHYTQPDPAFKMECLTRQFAEHPVSMTH